MIADIQRAMRVLILSIVTLFSFGIASVVEAAPGDPVWLNSTTFSAAQWEAFSAEERQSRVTSCMNIPSSSSDPSRCVPKWNGINGEPLPASQYTTAPEENGAVSEALFGPKTVSMMLFESSLGTGSNSCLSCNFMSFFMLALSDFSFMVYQYFYNLFLVLAPAFFTVWLGYRAAKLMVMGGEDGKDFLFGVVAKIALFAMVWMFATGANKNNEYLWQAVGPQYLNFAFKLSNEIRNSTINNTSLVDGSNSTAAKQMLCNEVTASAVSYTESDARYSFIKPAVEAGCFTERAHVLGIATGAALAFDSYGGANFGWTDFGSWFRWLLSTVFKALIGLFVAIIYAVSAIWLIFLALDIVTRGLITAAFSPVLMILYVYKPTRQITTRALTAMAGAMVTAVALAMISVMAYVLVTNTAKVYDTTKGPVIASYEDWNNDEVPNATQMPSVDSDRVNSMRNFIKYVGVNDSDAVRIPMDFGTPWFWYLAFCGVAIFALGKKIIKMLEDAVGYQGASEFANSALKSVRMGAVGAAGGAAVMAAGAGMAAGVAGKGASWAAGGVAGQGKAALLGAGKGLQWAGDKIGHKNVLAASGMAMRQAQRTRPEDE